MPPPTPAIAASSPVSRLDKGGVALVYSVVSVTAFFCGVIKAFILFLLSLLLVVPELLHLCVSEFLYVSISSHSHANV